MLYPTEVDSGRDGEIKEQERKLINLSLCGHRSVNKRANQKAFCLFTVITRKQWNRKTTL